MSDRLSLVIFRLNVSGSRASIASQRTGGEAAVKGNCRSLSDRLEQVFPAVLDRGFFIHQAHRSLNKFRDGNCHEGNCIEQ